MGAPQKEQVLAGREACVEALSSATARASAGRFAVVEVRGAAGMGKSRVLAEAGRLAGDAGLRVCAERAAHGGPLALLFDDLHRADHLSLVVVEDLIRHPPDGVVLAVVAFRDAHPPAGIVDAVSRAGDAAWRIWLGPLHDLRSLLPHCSDRRRDLLMRASQGNPRYLRMLADLPDATLGDLIREGGDFEPEPADGIVHMLTAELATLPAPTQRVAQAIAISGEHAALDLVASVAQLPVPHVVDAMDELCAAGLGTMDGAWFTFQHPLLCAATRATAGPAWRTRAHARAAEYLRSHDAPPRLLAHHLERSAQYGDDTATLLEVGDALVFSAPTTAVRLLGKASRIHPPPDTTRYAQALLLAGELDRAWDVLQSQPLPAEATVVAAEIARLRGDLDTATALLAELSVPHERLEPGAGGHAGAPIQRAALAALRADAVATAEHASQYDGGQPALVAGAATFRAWAALASCQVAAARTHARAAAHLFDGLDTRTLVPHVELIGLLAAVETRLGDTATAAAHLARAYEVIDQTGLRSALPYILVVDAILRTRQGRLPSALDLTEQAATLGSAEQRALAHAVRLRPLMWVRGPAAAVDLARTSRQPRSPAWRRIARLNLAIAHAAADDAGAALTLLTDDDWPVDPLTQVLRLGALALAGDRDTAARAADDAELVALASGLDYEIGLAWYAEAHVAAHAGLAARAAARFATCGAALDEARAHHLAGLCATDPDQAHAELGLAKAGFAACGADWLLSEAARDHRRIAARNGRRRGSTPDGVVLTVRERQIAELVAGGLTNQQIADRLFLSRRTVESHLSRIFPKLAVRTRLAMARRLRE